MPDEHEIRNLCEASLEDVLNKLYLAPFYRWLYETKMRELAQAHLDRLPQPESPQSRNKKQPARKDELANLLLAILRQPDLSRQFLAGFPPATQKALRILSWERVVNLQALETAVGGEIARLNPDERYRYYEPFQVVEEHGFVCVLRKPGMARWYYPDSRAQPKKEDFIVLLPKALRLAFKSLVAPPPDYELIPLDSPSSPLKQYHCSDRAIGDVRLVAEYIAQGHLKLSKSGNISKACLKSLSQMTLGPEFFEAPADADLELVRTKLLAGAIGAVGQKACERFLTSDGSAGAVRDYFQTLSRSTSFLQKELLNHLGSQQFAQYNQKKQAAQDLGSFFAKLPLGKWISIENIHRYLHLRDEELSPFMTLPTYLAFRLAGRMAGWSDRIRIDEHNAFGMIHDPWLKGYGFFLAAFGMAEIAYEMPNSPNCQRPGKTYLTPFDNLGFIRLTPLGEFVLDRRQTYEIAKTAAPHATVLLDESRLLVTCENADALTELTLTQLMEPIAPGRFKMTHRSLLGGCATKTDLEERIQRFRRALCASPPPIWEQFFQCTLARIAPLQSERDLLVLKLNPDAELQRLFAADPVLRDLVLKVEGLRIAVRKDDLKKVAKRLEHFGYLSPLAR